MASTYFSTLKLKTDGTILTVNDPNAVTLSYITGLFNRVAQLETELQSLRTSVNAVPETNEIVTKSYFTPLMTAMNTRIATIEQEITEITATTEPIQGGITEPENGFVGVDYYFVSYPDANSETIYATGKVHTNGETGHWNGLEGTYSGVTVIENSVAEFVGNKYFIISTATTDGQTRYQLIDSTGTAQPIWVVVSPSPIYTAQTENTGE